MTLAPWRSPLARALHRNRSLVYARYFQLATIRADGHPANRTVVFRGFLDNTNQLKMITDARSEKADQIDQNAWGEACWYFPKTREQFRLLGQLTLVRDNCTDAHLLEARARSWQELSDAARVQFAWSNPGVPRDDTGFNPPLPDAITPLSHFCLLLLDSTRIDHLELKGDPQNRSIYSFSDAIGWSMQSVNP
ncbi:pyridoxamine 5'-phosphate oxidase family protein [Phormidium sp. CLA17]|uniref:Npun_F5749 family FMN-dependent PPOX-type flavoprotein n=1 Tax=Leptolyngbya sp. Cla-17 TaxID=2803751 RepID=UPI001490B0EA|nr:Npun_F5749 family FMN-dependent PPOX-type flavoprotein [Leptolyngbya sp. Cla-17]MBM0742714.1 pyridoxamine 5'-phosphate oxidase family protein [Leptolyngbya sp. Cla-17]